MTIPHVDPDKTFAFGPGIGISDSEIGLSVNGAVRFNETWQLGGSVGFSTDGGEVAGKAAIIGQW